MLIDKMKSPDKREREIRTVSSVECPVLVLLLCPTKCLTEVSQWWRWDGRTEVLAVRDSATGYCRSEYYGNSFTTGYYDHHHHCSPLLSSALLYSG